MGGTVKRRGWVHAACYHVEMREQLRHVPSGFPGKSALDVLDGLVQIIDHQSTISEGLAQRIMDTTTRSGRGRDA